MKKFSLALNLVFVCLTGCLVTRPESGATISNNCERVCLDYRNAVAYTLINGKLLDSMAKLHQEGMANQTTDGQSVWYSLEDLKRFIWEIESNACKSQCERIRPINLGIRIYYAKYPLTGKNSSFPELFDLSETYKGKHTLFMVPTYDVLNSNVHTDFLLPVNNRQPGQCLRRIGSEEANAFGPTIGALLPDGKNHGPLCPPDDCEGAIFSRIYH